MKTPVVPPMIAGVVSAGIVVSVVAGMAAVVALSKAPEPPKVQLRIPEKTPPRLVTLPSKRD